MRKLPREQFRALVDDVKRRASILEIAEDCGIGLRQEGACYKGFCPCHDDSATPSLVIWDDSGKWRCFGACQDGGDVLQLYQKAHGVKFREALFDLANRYGILVPGPTSDDSSSGEAAVSASMTSKTHRNRNRAPRKAGKPTEERTYEVAPLPSEPVDPEDLNRIWPYDRAEAVYIYRLVGGGVVHEVRYPNPRKKRKDSMFIRPTEWGLIYGLKDKEYYRRGHCWFYVNDKTPRDAERKWIAGAQVHLYRPEVLERARKGEDWIFLVEGPKDAETAIELGLYATTPACGASGLRTSQAEELRGHLVAVVGDHDTAGKKGTAKRAKMLRDVAREVRVLPPLGGDPGSGYDLTDFYDEKKREGQTQEQICEALQAKLEKAATEAARPGTPLEALLTDAANADRFVRRWGRDYRHCEKLRCWLYWDGSRFAEDWLNRAKHTARITAESIYAEAAEIAKGSDDEETKAQAEALRKHATRSLDARRIHAMLSLAKVSPSVAVAAHDFDRDPYQLNTPTGLLDVRTKGWRPHRDDPHHEHPMVSKVTGVTYDAEATCPRWERFLHEIFVDLEGQPDERLIAFIQVAVGYSLTASTKEHAIFILRGGGSNGKTVFVETIGRLLGDYSHTLQFDTLLAQKTANQNHPDIADLRGKRIAWASESAIGARFNEALLKQLSGGDRITAARKFANPVTFEATHKLWLASNHSPRTYDLSEGFWRRVHQVPFRVKFPRRDAFVPGRPLERRRDPDLKEKLIEELPGILNWALEGCQRWLADGLGMCDAVRQATAEYRADQDPLAAFLEDCCVLDPDGSVPVRELYSTYEGWCEKAGEDVKDRRVFGRLLTERGVETGKSMSTRVRRGIRLRRADDPPSEASEQPDLHPPVQPSESTVAPFDPTASRPPF